MVREEFTGLVVSLRGGRVNRVPRCLLPGTILDLLIYNKVTLPSHQP